MSPTEAMIWPMIAHVALIFCLYLLLSRRRVGAVKEGRASVSQFRENREEPSESLVVKNCIANQFELPVLFYILIALALLLRKADLVIVLLSWVFVVTRFAHAGIFVTSNDVRSRSLVWFAGALVLFAMWLYFALKMLLLS